ncbi:MAG: UDP-glucose 4-epimerase GalE [Xanthomonadales bacterium]|nr:UDP-glucose 4-epimerase GalE [Xanthomonadales bacterium]
MSSGTVLVTGGAGYIGSHCCKLLAAEGFEPVTYDNLFRGHRELVKWGPFVEGDIRDRDLLEKTIRRYRPAAVMHFAALSYVGESVENPGLYHSVNVGGSEVLLRAMTACKVKQVVFSSTCATYGIPESMPIDEQHPQQPVNPYGVTKLAVEQAIGKWSAETNGSSVMLRYFNAAGADPELETGEWHEPETHLIPLALAAADGQGPGLTIFGDDYPTPDGTCIRDYIHVTDLVQAHLLAMRTDAPAGESQAYNLGNGEGFSVRQVVDAVEQVTGKAVPVSNGARREGDPASLVGSSARARRDLGWQPRFDDLGSIIATAWGWYQQQGGPGQ